MGTAPGQAAAGCTKEPPSREHPAATMGPPSDLEPAGTPGGKGPSRSGRGQVSCSRSNKTPQRGGLNPHPPRSPGPGLLSYGSPLPGGCQIFNGTGDTALPPDGDAALRARTGC